MIRPAKPEDVEAVCALAEQSATAAHWTEAQYRDIFSVDSRRVLLVADNGGQLDGFVVAADAAGDWELENIVVRTEARGQGLGMQLIKALFKVVQKRSGEAIFLEVRESNNGARNLYERSGFRVCGVRSSYYADPQEDAILYEWKPNPAALKNG